MKALRPVARPQAVRTGLLTLGASALIGGLLGLTTFVVSAQQQVIDGSAIFDNQCARCHGASGQGGEEAAILIGPGNALSGYGNALALLNYTIENMPNDDPGTLPVSDYAAALAFILGANGYFIPGDLTPDNAASISLTR